MLVDVAPEHVEGWAEELASLTAGLGYLFARPEPREVFADLIEGLLSDLGRKNGWTMAERAGHATPHRIQKFLGEASWDADALLAKVQDYIAGRLGDEQATLVLDDTQVIKKGTRSVGVAHQHCGVTGDVRNWERRSQGEGSKGQRYYDWAWFEVALPGQEPADGFAHHLLIRRSTDKKQLAGGRVDFEYAYFLVHHRRDAALGEAVCRAGVRWKIEENNEQAKQITGLGQYQVRRWNSWHRHVTCAMLALAFLTVQRAQHPEHHTVSHHEPEQGDEQGKAGQTRETSTYR